MFVTVNVQSSDRQVLFHLAGKISLEIVKIENAALKHLTLPKLPFSCLLRMPSNFLLKYK